MTALGDMVIDDKERGVFRVHRASMTSEDILATERERIFDQCWLYLGHESELVDPGDYRRRVVNGRSIIFVRSGDGVIRAFVNVTR